MNQKKFGAFAGVFTPSILTILGVIMYLRLGWVVGQAGLIAAIVIIIIAHVISITTGLSITAISTDKKIKAGGIYYMLSRSLGLPMGGAIGITLFVGTALSISLYLVGFTESVFAIDGIRNFLGIEGNINDMRIVASAVLLFLVILAFISTSLAIKTQFLILGAIIISLFSIIFGIFSNVEIQTIEISRLPFSGHLPFETIFAIFFPAVTGFTAGVAMSGDLKDPKKSIPRGTLGAILVGLIVYLGLTFIFAYFIDRDLLLNDTNFLTKIAWFSPLVIAGIWGATLSSALGGILGGPRILQAVAADKILPPIFARGQGINNEPRNALILTFLLAESGILIGELNAIAEVVSMFYISAYGFINLSFALEKWASSDFRPSFRIPAWIGIIGFIASFIVMFKMNTLAMFGSMIIVGFIYLILKRKQFQLDFGDVWQSVYTTLIRASLHKIDQKELEQRNWKPNIILFSGGTENRSFLLEFGKSLVGKHGFLSNFDLIENKNEKVLFSKQQQSVKDELSKEYQGIFSRKQTVSDLYSGIETIAQTYGFSGVEPNTVMLNWAKKGQDYKRFVGMLQTITDLDLNLIMVDYDRSVGFGKYETIDIWWRGGGHNGNFALSLVKFLWASEQWRNAKLRLLIVNPNNEAREKIERDTNKILDTLRLNAEVKVINNQIERRTFFKIIRDESTETDLIIMGVPKVTKGAEEDFVTDTLELCKDIGTVMFLKASTQFKALSVGTSLFKKRIKKQSLEIMRLITPPVEIPQIKFTHYDNLNVEISSLNNSLKNLFSALIKQHQKIDFQGNVLLHNELKERVHIAISQWKQELKSKQEKDFTKNQSLKIITRIRKLIDDEYKDLLEIVRDQNVRFIQDFQVETNNVIEKIPEQIELLLTDDDLKMRDKDNFAERRFKLRQRKAKKKITNELKYTFKLKRFVRSNLFEQRFKLLNNYYSQAGLLIYNSQLLFKKLTSDVLKSIDFLDKCAYYNKLDENELLKAQNELDRIFDDYTKQVNLLQENVRNKTLAEINELLQQLVNKMKMVNPNRFLLSESKISNIEKSTLKVIQDIPKISFTNVLLLSNSLRLAVLLHYFKSQQTAIFANNKNNFEEKIKQLHQQIEQSITNDSNNLLDSSIQKNIDFSLQEIISSIKIAGENTVKRISIIAERLPKHLVILDKDSSEHFEMRQFTQLQSIDISFSHMVDYITQNEIIAPFEQYIANFINTLESDVKRILNLHRLFKISINTETTGQLSNSEKKKQIDFQKEKIEKALTTLLYNFEINDRHFTEIIGTIFDKLQYNRFIAITTNKKQYTKATKTRKKSGTFASQVKRGRNFVKEKLVSLVYLTSRSTLAAREFIEGDSQSLFQTISNVVQQITPRQEVVKNLPFYYNHLFTNKQHFLDDFWVGREKIMQKFITALQQDQSEFKGVLLLLGDRNSGKSFWLNYAISQIKPECNAFIIQPQYNQSLTIKSFNQVFRKATNSAGSIESILEKLPYGTCLIFDDIELWWNQHEGNNMVINHLLRLIQSFSTKIKFVLAANNVSYEMMRRNTDLKNLQPYIFSCKPLNSYEIGKAILKRHYSGGLQLGNTKRKDGKLTAVEEAKFFSKIFMLSFGNIGHAMLLWISSIEKIEDEKIFIKVRKSPDMRFLEAIPAEWIIILNQLIIHKELSISYFENENTELIKSLNEMLRSTLIIEPNRGYIAINPHIYPYVLVYFRNNKLI